MIDLLTYFTPDSVIPMEDTSYIKMMESLVYHCLKDYPQEVRQKALEDIQSKSRSRSPQDINLGKGFALIHSKIDEVEHIHTAVGLLPKPKKLLKGERIQSLLCIILPSSQGRVYLSLLAKLGRLLQQQEAQKTFSAAGKLLASGNHEDAAQRITDLIREFEQG